MSGFRSGICNNKWQAVPRQPDADIFYIHCTGGFRGAKATNDHWQIVSVFESGEARAKGFLTDVQLRQIIRILETKGLRVRHDETHPNGFTVYGGIFEPRVSATILTIDYVEMQCRSTSFNDDGTVEVIDGSKEYVVTDDSSAFPASVPVSNLSEARSPIRVRRSAWPQTMDPIR